VCSVVWCGVQCGVQRGKEKKWCYCVVVYNVIA
jgi:hypothetical protein